jgi:glycosyltransferase involved in cell wall biosynthesis
VVLDRLLRPLHPDDVRLVTIERAHSDGDPLPGGLPSRTWAREARWRPPVESRYPLRHVRAARRFAVDTVRRAVLIARVARAERCGVIVAVSGQNPDPLAALLAARLLRRPLLLVLLDDWRDMLQANAPLRPMAPILDRLVMRGADRMTVPNAGSSDAITARHGERHRPLVMPNPLPPDALTVEPPDVPWPARPDALSIVFTGQLYEAQADAVDRVLRAIEAPDLAQVTLHLHTAATTHQLERLGLHGRLRLVEAVPPEEIRAIQAAADILLLPLAFHTPYPGIIRTATPAKLSEYLISGRPILVHAPPDSHLVQLARADGFAEVVDTESPDDVAAAIRRLAAEPERRERLVRAARETARRRFGPAATTDRFRATLVELLTTRA